MKNLIKRISTLTILSIITLSLSSLSNVNHTKAITIPTEDGSNVPHSYYNQSSDTVTMSLSSLSNEGLHYINPNDNTTAYITYSDSIKYNISTNIGSLVSFTFDEYGEIISINWQPYEY